MDLIKFNLHSVVDVITNSSTVIYTYQSGCEEPAKELINEMLKLSGVVDKTADDIFYFGVFCDNEQYLDRLQYPEDWDIEVPEDFPKDDDDEQETWMDNLKMSIMKKEVEKPDWMESCETNEDSWDPDTYLILSAKDEKYKEFGDKIVDLLGGIEADGGRDG